MPAYAVMLEGIYYCALHNLCRMEDGFLPSVLVANLICGLRGALIRNYSSCVVCPRFSVGRCLASHTERGYDSDLRWRMIFQRKVMGLSVWQTS